MGTDNSPASLVEAECETEKFIASQEKSILETAQQVVWLVDVKQVPRAMGLNVTEYFEKKLSSVLKPKTASHYLAVGRMVVKFENDGITVPKRVKYTALRELVYSFEGEENRLEMQADALEYALEEKEDGPITQQDMLNAIQAVKNDNELDTDLDDDSSDHDYENPMRKEIPSPVISSQNRLQGLREVCEKFTKDIKVYEKTLSPKLLKEAKRGLTWDSSLLIMIGDSFSAFGDMIHEEIESETAINSVNKASDFIIELLTMAVSETDDDEIVGDYAKNLARYFSKHAVLRNYQKMLERSEIKAEAD